MEQKAGESEIRDCEPFVDPMSDVTASSSKFYKTRKSNASISLQYRTKKCNPAPNLIFY